ncbi:MAG: peptidylprolyl isomerase [Ferruginibacter sp.]
MKKSVVLLVISLWASHIYSQTLFTYGSGSVSKDEFLRAYNKNKTPVDNKEKALREYIELYYRFKLKVQAAKQLQLDTLQQQVFDLQNFRSQVAEAYMIDGDGLNKLVDEALMRSQKDIHLFHFYINIPQPLSVADSLKAYAAMDELAKQLKLGTTDYSSVLAEISRKYIGVKGMDIGYITALSVPYEIENLVYGLQVGGISKPYCTKSSLHLFKKLDERKSAGKWQIAQVLLSVPPEATPAEIKTIELKADSIYMLLTNGADFSVIAKQYSEDKLTAYNGGELPEFGTGKYELPFENKVFELKKDGEISKPIFTGYGYHIVKRIHHMDIPSDKSDEIFLNALKQQLLKDDRINSVRSKFLETIKTKTGYRRNSSVSDAILFQYADSVVATNRAGKNLLSSKTIFSFAKSHVKGAEWMNFIKDYKLNADVYKGETNKALLQKFISTSTLDYYRRHLEEFDKEFKYQVTEFKEGNMLFDIMEKNVWGKAAGDSAALERYYHQHKAMYKWGASANVLLFNCSDIKVAEAAATSIKSGKTWLQLMEESDGKVQIDSGRYELQQLQLAAGTELKEGFITAPIVSSGDKTTSFIQVLKMFPPGEQRSFEDAKGLLISDYQSYLEDQWLSELKRNHPLRLNEAVFQTLLK